MRESCNVHIYKWDLCTSGPSVESGAKREKEEAAHAKKTRSDSEKVTTLCGTGAQV